MEEENLSAATENPSTHTLIREALADKIVQCIKKLNQDVLEACNNTLLDGVQLENRDKWLGEDAVLNVFKQSFENLQQPLEKNDSHTRSQEDSQTLPELAEKATSTLKAEIQLVKSEQVQVLAEINNLLNKI